MGILTRPEQLKRERSSDERVECFDLRDHAIHTDDCMEQYIAY